MALWAKSQQLPEEARQELISVYGDHFPIEVRHHLANWIENKMMHDIDDDNPQHEQYIETLVLALINEIESKAATFTNEDLFLTKLKMENTAAMFRHKYLQNPRELYQIVRQCLEFEVTLASAVESCNYPAVRYGSGLPDSEREILHKLAALRQKSNENGELLRQTEQELEGFALECHELSKIQASICHLQSQPQSQQKQDFEKQLKLKKEVCERKLNQKLGELSNVKTALSERLGEVLSGVEVLQSGVLDAELANWRRQQQCAGNGFPFNNNIDTIQEWCGSLAEILWFNRQQLKDIERLKPKFSMAGLPSTSDSNPVLLTKATNLLSVLVKSTFIIERQPPQVMKTNTRFTSVVRLLVGGKLNLQMTPPQVSVTIVSELQANNLLKNDRISKNDICGEILNNTGTMEYDKSSGQMTAAFRNLQLRKIKRAEKRGSESVMDEKFALLFQTKFFVGGKELEFQVWTLSLPVVVIVHGNQEPHAWATVTWDNAFADPRRPPFVVPDKVPWSQVAETLSVKFHSVAGRGLTEDNMRFLAAKAFRNPNIEDPSNLQLSWALFCKEPLPERSFTFWEWFYAIMKLTREHLRGPWMDNTIIGFVDRRQTEEMLSQCQRGTFLLRFSDSGMGGVTIAWIGDQGEVYMVQPFTTKDFAIRTLADRISDLKNLIYLYPNIGKDQAFSKYYTPLPDTQSVCNGYVKPLLVTQIPGWSDTSNFDSASLPATPNPNFHPMTSPSGGIASVSPASGLLAANRESGLYGTSVGDNLVPEFDWSVEELENMDEFSVDITSMSNLQS